MPASSWPICSNALGSTPSPLDELKQFQFDGREPRLRPPAVKDDKETIETIGETSRKSSPVTSVTSKRYNLQVHPTARTGCPPPGRLSFTARPHLMPQAFCPLAHGPLLTR